MSIRNIGILGAGAVGASIAHQLLRYSNPSRESIKVSVIAVGERSERYRRNGIPVNSDVIHPEIIASGQFDLIVIATKSYHLDEALGILDSCVGEQTLLLSLLNGIDSEGILGERYGHGKVIPAMILGIDAQRDDSGIRYANDGVIHFGTNPEAAQQREAVDRLETWFDANSIGQQRSDNITNTLWRKFMINVGANQASALYKAPYSSLQTETEARRLMFAAMEEVVALSKKEGTGLTRDDIGSWDAILQTLHPDGMTSMAQDSVAGRKMEVDLFAGTVVKLAEKHGLDVPVNCMFLKELKS